MKSSPEASAAPWWNESWQYRTKLTIDHSKIDDDLTNFPVAIHLNGSRIAYSKAQADGDDLRFTLPNGTELNYELEKWDAAATSTIWVRLPDVEADIPTDFFMYYGNSSVGSAASSTLVWDENFKLVQHLKEDPTPATSPNGCDGATKEVCDSTSNNNDGDSNGTMTSADQVVAKVDGGIDFDGTDDYVDLNVKFDGTTITVSAWVYVNFSYTITSYPTIIGALDDFGEYGWNLYYHHQADQWRFWTARTTDVISPLSSVITSDNALGRGRWQHFAAVADATQGTLYIDGISVGTDTGSGTYSASISNARIGHNNDFSAPSSWVGLIDEVRISNITRSAAWIKADYNSGQDTLLSFGQEETGKGPVGYWSFDEGFGSTAYNMMSATGTDGAISGANWKSEEFCVSGKCLEFDGTDDVVTIANPSLFNYSNTDTFTIAGWVNIHTDYSSGYRPLISQGDGSTVGWGLYAYDTTYSGRMSFTKFNSAGVDLGYTLSTKRWVHVAYTHNAGAWNLYVDGVPETSGSNASAIISSNNNLRIATTGRAGEYLKSAIDEVKVYRRVLSADEVKADFASRGGQGRGSSAVFGAYDQKFLSDGLVGYWPMNESAANSCTGGVNDSCDFSGLANDGAWTGGATATTTAKFGRGVGLDGVDDYVSMGAIDILESQAQLTLCAWIKPDSGLGGDIFGQVGKSADLFTNAANTVPRWRITNGATERLLDTATTLTAGQWYHLCGTYDAAGDIHLYLNGERDESGLTGTLPSQTGTTGNSLLVGGATGDFGGSIDEVRIYNRALDPLEVRKLFQWSPGPVAHWTMDEKVSGDAKTIYNVAATSTLGLLNGTTVDGANNTGMDCSVRGKFGGACQFDGTDDYVDVPDSSLAFAGQFTFSMWFFKRSSAVGVLFGEDNGSTSGGPKVQVRSGDIQVRIVSTSDTSTPAPSLNTWHHLVVRRDSSDKVDLILDGVPKRLFSDAAQTGTYTLDTLGVHGGDLLESLNGLIDDVQIFDYALSQKQIVNIMNGRQVYASAVGSPVGSAVGHWSFEEGGGTIAYDSGIGGTGGVGNNGTYTGNASSTPEAGRLGRGVELDGTGDYVEISNPNYTSNEMTISAWVKADTFDATESSIAAYRALSAGWASNRFHFSVWSTKKLNFEIGVGSSSYQALGDTTLVEGTWYHVVGVYDGSNIRVYLNGVEDDLPAPAASGNLNNNSAWDLYVGSGGSSTLTSYEWDGFIDEVKIYNYALSEEEVKLEFNQGKSAKLGSLSTESDGKTFTDSAEREYCIPGDTSTCRPPVGEWRMDEKQGQTARDTSSNANDGTLGASASVGSDDPAWDRGKIGSALKFDGVDDAVDVAADSSLSLVELTLSAWVKPMGPSSGWRAIIWHNNVSGGANEYGFWRENSTDKLHFRIRDKTLSSNTVLEDDQWYHIVGTYDGNDLRIYVNGQFETITPDSTVPTPVDTTLHIGDKSTGERFNGLIDHVRIYDYARTAAQVAWEYNRGGPVGWWKLDECSGTTAYDSSGKKNHGTITIGATGTNTEAGTCVSGNTAHAWNNGKTGKRNYSLDFDGTSDYVFISDANSLDDQNDAVTVSGWFKPANTMNSGTSFTQLVTKNDAGGADCSPEAWDLYYESGSLVLFFAGSPNFTNSFTTNLNANQWYHIVGTYDKQNIKLYLDGKLVKTVAETQGINSGNCDVVIGADEGGDAYFFDGQIDEVKVWNYALTPLQIKNEYNGGAVNFAPLTGAP